LVFTIVAAAVAGIFGALAQTPRLLHSWLWGMSAAWSGAIVPCLLFTIVDLRGARAKNPGNRYPTRRELSAYGGVVFTTLTVITVPDVLQLWWSGVTPAHVLALAPDRALWILILELLFVLVAADALTFLEHWVRHRIPWLWKNVHLVHHSFDHRGASLFSWAGIWVHPIEALVFLLAMLAGPTLLALSGLYVVHPLSLWAGLFLYVALVVEEHSGFDFVWSVRNWLPGGLGNGAHAHEIHHGRVRKNLGFILTIWDRMAGTLVSPRSIDGAREDRDSL
jgi:sterol desaturase/sphingolipid hydroxylase (fatty acid hydroxylase superfamily)